MKIRKPAVAGSFYPGNRAQLAEMLRDIELEQESEDFLQHGTGKIIGGIVPHAGYIYSGRIALPFFQCIAASSIKFDTIIILHPNHHGRGPSIALDEHEIWETPLGQTLVDHDFGEYLKLERSLAAHQFEHSAEVMLPFLQYFLDYPFKILPVAFSRLNPASARDLALRIKKAKDETKREVLLIASSDFSHFVSTGEGKKLDDKAIAHIFNLDTSAFYNTVNNNNISICGNYPIMTLMEFAKIDNKSPQVHMIARGHSGQVSQHDDVVHYVSMLFYEPDQNEATK
jgi:AmmeMemoRadiSam system protein B